MDIDQGVFVISMVDPCEGPNSILESSQRETVSCMQVFHGRTKFAPKAQTCIPDLNTRRIATAAKCPLCGVGALDK